MTDELPIVLLHGSATGSYSWAAVRMGFHTRAARIVQDHIAERQLLSTCLGSATVCWSPQWSKGRGGRFATQERWCMLKISIVERRGGGSACGFI